MGAAQVIAIDHHPHRLELARQLGANTVNFRESHVLEALMEMSGGIGVDAVIDAVGMEAHGSTYDDVKQTLKMETDRPHVLRQAIRAVRKGGVLSIPGVYGGFVDKIPFGALMNKGITIKSGQTHMQRYMRHLLSLIEDGKIDPSFVVTHRVPLSKAPEMYETFVQKNDGCIKVVLDPAA
jgi:threonine dehydrogenase-like Zn-dependent dehydrogenase